MIEPSHASTHYKSAASRFLTPLVAAFFHRELRHYGPELSQRLAERIVEIFDAVCPETSRLRPGQMLWTVIHKETRADSKNRKFVPVVLTVVDEEDTQKLAAGMTSATLRRERMAKMFEEAYAQGGLLSTRDAAMIFHLSSSYASQIRQEAERERSEALPHPGILHDVGSTITHKPVAVRKVVYEKQDPADVARSIRHTQKAVDHYVASFQRVRTVYKLKPDIDFISTATGISRSVVREYVKLIEEYETESA